MSSVTHSRTVCLYEMVKGTKDFTFYGVYETGSTLKDVRSIEEIVLSSDQTWNMETRTKYISNSITSVKVSLVVVLDISLQHWTIISIAGCKLIAVRSNVTLFHHAFHHVSSNQELF